MRFTQDIFDGFNSKEDTVAIFIDLEKAYDSVWRDGLLVKLHNNWIRGRVWRWDMPLYGKTGRPQCVLPDWKGQEFTTETGLPQGSVIAPLLFIIYISDLFENVTSKKSKILQMTAQCGGQERMSTESLEN